NGNTAATQFSVTNDATAPTLAITGPAGPVSGDFTVTFIFDEDVTGFVVGDISVGNGAASNFQATSATVYTATITPASDGAVTVDVAADVAADAAGNTNTAATQFSVTNDETAPTTTSVDNVQPGSSPTNADTVIWAMFFSESLANLDASDIQLTGTTATITEITNPQPNLYAFTASGGDLAGLNGTITIGLAPGHDVTDDAGNALSSLAPTGAIDDRSVIIDNTVSTLAITGPAGPVSGEFTASLVFSEPITGFDISEITVGNGSAKDLRAEFALPNGVSSSSTIPPATNFLVTITPAADGTVTVDVAADVAEDAAANGNTAATQFSVTNDATAPTLAITGPAGPVSGAFTVTFTFDEDVTGFVVGDISVGNGAASNFQATSATVYTATITPASDGVVTVDVAGAVVQDAAANGNTAAT
ncbi:Ig-like domain-containing protein, partial [Hyphobacterium sp. HN65]